MIEALVVAAAIVGHGLLVRPRRVPRDPEQAALLARLRQRVDESFGEIAKVRGRRRRDKDREPPAPSLPIGL